MRVVQPWMLKGMMWGMAVVLAVAGLLGWAYRGALAWFCLAVMVCLTLLCSCSSTFVSVHEAGAAGAAGSPSSGGTISSPAGAAGAAGSPSSGRGGHASIGAGGSAVAPAKWPQCIDSKSCGACPSLVLGISQTCDMLAGCVASQHCTLDSDCVRPGGFCYPGPVTAAWSCECAVAP
jgi:hypothetical protein